MTPRMIAIAIAKEEAARAGIDIDALLGESRRPEHVRARIARWEEVPMHLEPEDVAPVKSDERQETLFR